MLALRLSRQTAPRTDFCRRRLSVLGREYAEDGFTNVPQSIISKLPHRLYAKRDHPIATIRSLIEEHFGPQYDSISVANPIVTPLQNFDELGFAKDHPGRSKSDSYYLNKDHLLRTHTSAHELEVFRKGTDKWLLAADVYRRDEIDASHYPVFHQMEGACVWKSGQESMHLVQEEIQKLENALKKENIIIEDIPHVSETNPVQKEHDPVHSELIARHLKLSINSLILKLFASPTSAEPLRVRWIEAFFPFTSPSYEVEVFFGGKWLEVLGCGVIIHRTLTNSNQGHKIGWAFGLGLERLAMVLFQIPDIRLFWSQDPRFLNQFTHGQVTQFKPYSKYPSCFKDISFWNDGIHENDFCDLVRDVAGDLVEDVKTIDKFVHPKTKRESVCYRINYRSMDRNLENEEVNVIHNQVVDRVKSQFGAEIR